MRPIDLPELRYIVMLVGFFVVVFLTVNGLARVAGYKE